MMFKRRFGKLLIGLGILALLAALAAMLSCGATSNGGGGDDDDDSGGGDDDDGGGDDGGTTIYQIQQGEIADGTVVTLNDVVVTTPMGFQQEAFFIEEPAAGQYSGIYVYVYSEVAAALDIYPGDIIDITAEYTEYNGLSELTLAAAADITVKDSGDVPAPEVVDAADVATGGTLAEAYEGVLIKVEDVSVTTAPDSYGEWIVDSSLLVGDLFFPDGEAPEPAVGETFSSITGPLGYSFDNFKIFPRGEDDLAGGGGDDTDDDDDAGTTIYDIQQGNVTADTSVTLSGVIATTPIAVSGQGFFVEEPAGGEYSGIYVFVFNPGGKALTITPGDELSFTGTYTEYNGLSEITVENGTDITKTGTASVPAPAEVDPADVATGGSLAENYEGVLVQVTGVTVTAAPDTHGEWIVDSSLRIDDLFYHATPVVSDAFASVTGVMYFSFDEFKLEPRSADDLVE